MPMLERPIPGVQMQMLKVEKHKDTKKKSTQWQYDATAQVSRYSKTKMWSS